MREEIRGEFMGRRKGCSVNMTAVLHREDVEASDFLVPRFLLLNIGRGRN